jgi:diguanylate cyclase
MLEQDFARLLRYAEMAIDLLKRASIVPGVELYEMLYKYALGTDAALNARLDQLFNSGSATAAEVVSLCGDYRGLDTGADVASVSERIAARIETVHDTISSAMASANLYSGSLQSASGDLSGAMGAEAKHQEVDAQQQAIASFRAEIDALKPAIALARQKAQQAEERVNRLERA